MTVKEVNFRKGAQVSPEVVRLLEQALTEAKEGKFTGLILVCDGPEFTNHSCHFEGDKQADTLMGFYERVVKPLLQDAYTEFQDSAP